MWLIVEKRGEKNVRVVEVHSHLTAFWLQFELVSSASAFPRPLGGNGNGGNKRVAILPFNRHDRLALLALRLFGDRMYSALAGAPACIK